MTPETTRRMAGGALAVSAFSIAVALLAYWRAGGRQDAERTHAEIRAAVESLREKQTELVDHTRGSLDAAYQNSRDRLTRVRELLRIEKDRAEAELKQQLDRTEADVDRLVATVELEARKTRDSTIASAEQAERALSQRVRTIEGRVALLRAKYKTRRAEALAEGRAYEEALRTLVEATDLLDQAQERLPREYDPTVASLRMAMHEALTAVQDGAVDIRARLEEALRQTNSLVRTLENDEAAAAGSVVRSPGHAAS
ncbi:hypothetical protein SAMN02745121_04004 [Nannocystis exedens]|uniref:Uncharacterized protein n=1 Tax=Nannocystis exedens TaxID=54 RepID=A0A1I1ZX64_9BACT|nr:hypothetical protein [Nannocystis exedens]PCC75273.1 hypothetical protein NAEX_08382 [Nannocystis exedens]SFE35998.1 hypothetical protein SAMN02745121_04004 [Nannocystis exedens]